MNTRAATVATWLGVGCSALGWAVIVHSQTRPLATPVDAFSVGTTPQGDWSRLLGAAPPTLPTPPLIPAAETAALRLDGVVAAQRKSLALIAVDGKPARVFAIGGVVHGDLVVRSVSVGGVVLAHRGGGQPLVLAMAARPGALPGAPGMPVLRLGDDVNDASPIVPPHADMRAPPARQAATAGSDWARMRANPPAQQPTDDALPAPATAADLAPTS